MDNFIGLFSHDKVDDFSISQITSSGCGVTSLLNVLTALKVVKLSDIESVDWSMCILRNRLNDKPLPEYLLSRSIAGCTGQDLVDSMKLLINENPTCFANVVIEGKFWSMQDIIHSNKTLSQFIQTNLENNCCMVVTLNLQLFGNDAWHHQTIYGMTIKENTQDQGENEEKEGNNDNNIQIHLLNPICSYSVKVIERLISTPSILLIRSEDIISRCNRPAADVSLYDTPLWKPYNVPNQINAVLAGLVDAPSHIVIPANYVGGIAVFRRDTTTTSTTST